MYLKRRQNTLLEGASAKMIRKSYLADGIHISKDNLTYAKSLLGENYTVSK